MSDWNRREVLVALGAGAVELAIASGDYAEPASSTVKPIAGSWFEFQHHATVEGVDWNPACVRFTAEQWQAKVKEIAEIGMEGSRQN